jgi:hydroxylaminobenzene mutase
MDGERRRLLRQGSLLLLISALIGIGVGAGLPHPGKWMAAHVSGLLTGILLIALGSLWSDLRLGAAARRRAMWLGLVAAWTGLLANVFAAAVNLPGPATDPSRQPDAQWHVIVFFAMLAIVVPSTVASFAMVWRGLRD